MAEKKETETPKVTQTIKPVYPVETYKGAKVIFCSACGDQLRTDMNGQLFCSQGKTKSQCPLLKSS